MDKCINIIIPTYNRPKYLERLLTDIYSNNAINDFNVIVINDYSSSDYSVVVNGFNKYTNFTYNKREINGGKNKALYDAFSCLKPDDYILVMDDKIRFNFSFKEITTSTLNENEIIGFDHFDKSKRLIGNLALKANMTMYEYYFKKHANGDKLWLFKRCQIDLDLLRSYFADNEVAFDDIVWTYFLWKCVIVETIHNDNINAEYLDNGVSKNISMYEINNPLTHLHCLLLRFKYINGILSRYYCYCKIKQHKKYVLAKYPTYKYFRCVRYELLWAVLYLPKIILRSIRKL